MEIPGMKEIAMCGLDCRNCGWRIRVGCPGCKAAMGHMSYGNCAVALCCIDKEIDHCGLCAEFPCELLNRFAFDKEHGDPEGTRIATLRKMMVL